MIELRELARYENRDEEVKIVCTDGQIIIGLPDSVDDEEESGIDEPGITVCTPEGTPIVIGLSEIASISLLKEMPPRRVAMA